MNVIPSPIEFADEALVATRVQAAVVALRASLGALRVPRHAAVVLAIEAPYDAALLTAALPDLCVLAPAEPYAGSAHAHRQLQRLRPALLVTDRPDCDMAEAARALGIAIAHPGSEPGSLVANAASAIAQTAAEPAVWPDDTALLLQTTGTTGEAKLVALSRANLAASIDGIVRSLGLGPADRTVTLMPLSHIHGLVAVLHASIAAGAEVFPIAPRDTAAFWRCLDVARPTWLSLVPALLGDLLETAPPRRPPGLAGLRLVRTASAALPLALRRRAEAWFGVPVIEAYGMTEACHQIASQTTADIVPGSVGRPAPGTEVAVFSPDGARLDDGMGGELCIRGPGVIRRYAWPVSANDEAFHGDWLRTGDLGRVDARTGIWLTGRIKEQINRGGETLSPADIEAVLLSHAAVAEAVVFPIPHPSLGEEVAAFCVPRRDGPAGVTETGNADTDARALIRFAAERLAYARVPKRIWFVARLPRLPSGKVSRIAIAAGYRDGMSLAASGANPDGAALWRAWLRDAFAAILGLSEVAGHVPFFALGGTSLHALRLLARLEAEHGMRLPPSVLLTHPSIAELASLLAEATPGEFASPDRATSPGDPASGPAEPIVASDVIAGLHFAARRWPHRLRGFARLLLRSRDGLTHEAAAAAFRHVVYTQPALRHRVETDGDGRAVWRALDEPSWPRLRQVDVAASAAALEADPTLITQAEHCVDFDSCMAPVRAVFAHCPDGAAFWYFELSETIADGFARALLPLLLDAALSGRELPSPTPFRALMTAAAPARRHRPDDAAGQASPHHDGEGEQRLRLETVARPIAPATWHAIEALARAEQLTPYAITWTVGAVLLARLADGAVPLRSAAQRRRTPDDFATLGSAVEATSVTPSLECASFIAAAREAMRRHFICIATAADAARGPGEPMYCFDFEDEAAWLREIRPDLAPSGHIQSGQIQSGQIQSGQIQWSRDLPDTLPDWDLKLTIRPPDGTEAASLRVTVDLASLSAARAGSLADGYARLLEAALATPHARPVDLPLAAGFDRPSPWQALPLEAKSALEGDPADMAGLFDAIFRLWPGETAVAWTGGSMTFFGLARAADAIARMLRAQGVTPADVVAFRLNGEPRADSLTLYIATQVACFRLGCALLPLSQQLPPAEAKAQIERLDARCLIVAGSLDCAPAWAEAAPRVALRGFPGAFLLAHPGGTSAQESGTALLLTSSGTTGTPKTIRLSQAMIIGLLRSVAASGLVPPEPGLLGQNIGFDAAISDVWLPWLFGRHVVLLRTERRTPPALAEARALGAKVLTLSPTVATAAVSDDPACFEGFSVLHLIGEVVPPILPRRIAAATPAVRLINGYGPTESGVLAVLGDIEASDAADVPIGFTLPGYRVAIVDAALRPLPPHWPGEIAIASPAPALGYVDAEMTAARFVALPGEARGPFYLTGDRGWIDAGGRLRFIGRADRQVKLYGVRVEIDGIEHRIVEVEGVADAAVLFVDDTRRPRLVAFVEAAVDAPEQDALTRRILEHCRAWLPRAAVPAEIVFSAAIPIGPTGKKSRAGLLRLMAESPRPGRDTGGGDRRVLAGGIRGMAISTGGDLASGTGGRASITAGGLARDTGGTENGTGGGVANGTDGTASGTGDGVANGTDGMANGTGDGVANGPGGTPNGTGDGVANGPGGTANGTGDGVANGPGGTASGTGGGVAAGTGGAAIGTQRQPGGGMRRGTADAAGSTAGREPGPPEPGTFEARLVSMWQELLGANGFDSGAIHPEDDVFALGASSLDALRMVDRIERHFDLRFPDHQMFVRRTIAAQAALLRETEAGMALVQPARSTIGLELHLVRPARDPARSRGAIIGMPLLGGGNHYAGTLAAHALPDHDIWAFSAAFTGSGDGESEGWFDCARGIAASLLTHPELRPRALIGFSLGGFIAWVVDRMLARTGRDVTPVINLDAGDQSQRGDVWRRRMLDIAPPGDAAPKGRMLLLHRAAIDGLGTPYRLHEEWDRDANACRSLPCRTVAHADFARPELFVAAREALAEWVESGTIDARFGASGLDIATPAGALFELLAARTPAPSRLRRHLDALPASPVDDECRLGLLFLALRCGDVELALGLTARLAGERPELRNAAYARIALLSEIGRREAAISVADRWCGEHGEDPALRARAAMPATSAPVACREVDLFGEGVDAALDYAAASGVHGQSGDDLSPSAPSRPDLGAAAHRHGRT